MAILTHTKPQAEEAKPTALEQHGSQRTELSGGDTLVLMVCKAFTGEIVRAVVRADQRIEQAIPEIADQIGYFTPDWEKIGLYNLTRDFEYDLDQVLSETRTQSGDLVIMADGAGCHKTG